MARRCFCSRLIAALREDPRLLTLPLAARAFFLLLAEAATRAPEPGLLPFADPRRLALLVSCSETEAETHLETLETEALILRDGAGIAVPLVRDASARSDVARRNGAAGGRPRKGETREAYLARRQQAMLLPIATPATKPAETQAPKPPPTTSKTITVSSVSDGSSLGGEDARAPEWVSLGTEIAEIAGLDGARGGFDFRPVQAWLAAGHSADTIRAAVRRVAERPNYVAGRVFSLKFFDRAVAQEGPAAPAPHRMTADERAADAARLAALEARAEALILSVGRRVVA